MKRIVIYFILTILCCSSIYAQKLTLTDLTTLCSKKNWEDVNQTLLAKKWTYYDSKKGNSYKYNTITWAYEKSYYNDKALAWFSLFTYEDLPNKISYQVHTKEAYSLIQNSISSAGFKLIDSEIEDNEIISTYANANYTLKISTGKSEGDDYWESSITTYNITLIKKAGIYDPDNGKKTDYYYNGFVQAEYTLLNGKINGQIKVYHDNGNLKKVGNYTNGIENGLFKEYDKSESIEVEYSMLNGELNGSLKTYYSNGKLKRSGSYLKGEEHGNFVEYDEYGNKKAEYTMSNGELNGSLKTYYFNGKLKRSGNYLKGEEHGNFVEYNEDGTKETEYVMANGMKNGVLKVYEDGKIDVSTTFKDDIKNGQRIEYYYNDETGKLQLKQIGDYLNDEKNGTWKLFFIEDNNTERLLKFENYTKDMKNGAFQDVEGDSLIIGNYRNDKLHGEYKIYIDLTRMLVGGVIRTDTANLTLITEGNYYSDEKNGYWKYYDFWLGGSLRKEGSYINGLKTGEWKYYYPPYKDILTDETVPYSQELYLVENYSNGRLNGKSTRYSYLDNTEIPCSDVKELYRDGKALSDLCTYPICVKILETTHFKNDKQNGAYELRDSLNEIVEKGVFKDGSRDGEWLHRYSDKGVNEETYFIYQKGNYTNNERNGKWVEYYTEGKIAKSFNYKNGKLHGEYIEWNNQNKPKEKKQFNYEKLTELIVYDSLGVNPKNKYEIYGDERNSYKCRRTEYLDDGFISQEYWIKKEIDHHQFELTFFLATNPELSDGTAGYKDGEFKLFNSDNQPKITGKFYKEDRIGLWTFYYYDQNVKIEANYTQNERTDEKYLKLNGEPYSGKFVYYDDDNGIKEERKIKDGLRNGKTVYIDTKANKTIRKEKYKVGKKK